MRRLKFFIHEFWWFGIRQAQASLFAGAMLAAIMVTKFVWHGDYLLPRYDFLFIYAITIQCIFIALKLETIEEVKVIIIFHIVGSLMELFKTHTGSWSYPEFNYIRIGGLPLFSGFMYSTVGSYIARAWRIFKFRFTHFPTRHEMMILSLLVYANFFSDHYGIDMRYGLFLLTAYLFWRTRIYYKPDKNDYWMPLLLGFVLVALFIWFAENIGSFGAAWVYPNQQHGWHIVPIAKMGSWFLLMIISFVLVSLLHQEKENR